MKDFSKNSEGFLFCSMSFPRTFEEWQENVLLAAADLLVWGAQLRWSCDNRIIWSNFKQLFLHRCSERTSALKQGLEFFLSPNHMTVGIVQTGKRWWGETLQLNSQTFEAEMFFFLYFQKYFWKSTSSPILSCFRWSLLWKVPTPGWWWNGRWMSSLMYSEELNHCLQIFMMFKWKYMHACICTCIPMCLHTYIPAYLRTYVRTHVRRHGCTCVSDFAQWLGHTLCRWSDSVGLLWANSCWFRGSSW